MSLKSPGRLWKSIGFRISLWHSGILILSSLVLLIIGHLILSNILERNDRKVIQEKLNQLAINLEKEGLEAAQREIDLQEGLDVRDSFFIRISGPENNTVISSDPDDFEEFEMDQLTVPNESSNPWIRIPEKAKQEDFAPPEEGEFLEIGWLQLPDGNFLQVGRSSEARGDFLKNFYMIFALVMIPVLLIVSTLLSVRTLRPLRSMIATVKSIQAGKWESRVPTTGSNDELDELATLFNGMLQKIETLIQGMKDSLDNVAHDLRTPITRLRAVAEEALQSENNQDAHREALADCMEESQDILAMLDTLMDISEAETGSIKLDRKNIKVKELIENTTDLYRYVAEDKGLQIGGDCSEDLLIYADQNRIRQSMANLVDNAIKYTDAGGQITLEAHQSNGEIVIAVRDTGTGIRPDELPQIWDRLYRSNDVRSQKGIGLGLSLVRAIVKAHGGNVEVTSDPGQGSVFKIRLPQAVSSD